MALAKDITDIDLIQGCRRNSRRHQELMYRRYYPKMLSMCLRHTSDRERAMMITNDGFLKVFKKIDQFSNKGSFEGWIRRIVYNSISDHFKKENKYLHYMILDERDRDYHQGINEQLYFEDLLKLVHTLPDKTQEVFRLYAIEGYTHVEIGKKIGISDGTSKWHLSEARKKLKLLIKQQSNLKISHG